MGRGRRRGRRGLSAPMPVYNAVNYLEPTATVPVVVQLAGAGVLALNVPSVVSGRPWRLTSVDLTLSANNTNGVGSAVVRLFGGVAGATAGGLTEETLRTRRFAVGTAPINIKIKQSSRVQHVSVAGAVAVVEIDAGTNAIVVDGVANFSVRGTLG